MPFALTTIGLLLVITGFQNTYKSFFTQVEKDFSGSDSFIYWCISLFLAGSLGYIPELKNMSRWFMALIILGLIISNKGVFAQFTQQIQSGDSAAVNAPGAAVASDSGGSTTGAGNDTIGNVANVFNGLSSVFSF